MDQEFINQLAEKLSKLGTKRPLGFHYAHPFDTVPPDSIICNGAEYNRTLYADFFAYATEQGWVKTEAEWQEIASQNNGYCSYYSDGDGSTTFRTPKFAPFIQVAIASGNVGNYYNAGIPNITGSTGYRMTQSAEYHPSVSGSFYLDSTYSNPALKWRDGSSNAKEALIRFDASRQSNVFGASSTVQPESHNWMICVVVFGIATNVGSTDVGNVMSAVAQVQAKLPNNLSNTTPLIVDTWKSGSSWYRVWSDGWIEQGGEVTSSTSTLTFPRSFSLKNYFLSATDTTDDSVSGGINLKFSPVSNSYCTVRMSGSNDGSNTNWGSAWGILPIRWYACGY